MYINGHNLCIGCMRPLGPESGCSFCDLKQEEYTPIPRCLMPGTELAGRYVTGKVLGEGSFGITYMAWDTYMDIPVAVKEYFPGDMVSRDVICGSDNSVYLYENDKKHDYHLYLKKFWGEAKCLSRFNQVEGIVSVRDFFYENNTAYLVMQYVDGISVKKYVAQNGKIPAGQVMEQIRPVLRALEQVHNTGIIHRDISPDNLMIKEDGSFVLIDFGAARMRNIDYTKTMTVMFKRGFSPEEQYRCKGKWGPYTDVYSICATIYFMVTGSPPVDSVIRALGDEMPSLVSMKELDIPVKQRKAVMKGLAVSAKNRWQDIGELYEALFEQGDETGYRRRLHMMGGGKWGNRKKTVAAVLCMFLFLGVIVGSIYFVRHNAGAEQGDHFPVQQTVARAPGASEETGAVEGEDRQLPESAQEMITVVGENKTDAKQKLAAYVGQIEIIWKEKYSDKVKKGCIISQSIPEGERTGEYMQLTLVVSRGEKKVNVPELTGIQELEAKERLGKKGLKCKVKRVGRKEKKGTVVAQSVRVGKQVPKGTEITLTVSSGKAAIPAPTPTPKVTASRQGAGDGKKSVDSEEKRSEKKGDFAGVIQ